MADHVHKFDKFVFVSSMGGPITTAVYQCSFSGCTEEKKFYY